MKPGLSLQRKIVLASIGYTSVLILSILIYYLFTGRNTIQQHTCRELKALHFFYSEQYASELSDIHSEIQGLQSQLEIAFLRHHQGDDQTSFFEPVDHFLMAYPEKYASMIISDPRLPVSYRLQPITELGEMGIRKEPVESVSTINARGFYVTGPSMASCQSSVPW